MTDQSLALVYKGVGHVEPMTVPIPEIPGPSIRVALRAAGICGSDVMEWYRIHKAPLVLGHEIAGEVVEIGDGVDSFKIGDRVAATHHVPCNTCHYCLTGHETVCDTLLSGTHFDPRLLDYFHGVIMSEK